ncbi:UbiA family prenyltransferase [Pseudonocardia endophytica]|uniref:4-hydroxybenzoate polyprenyltransferase n=1 Tax=Pseudonocardia endophytica TaxID=401976 RepID=A0A4R1HSE6_PSEEN|nr:UbiA family prenyltransferase [Pseudonocardia endophytica]TCK25567.1 4-hydroxybenzoate polyprenyltransferase [Pseudonocardia endophytica]
MRTVLVLLRCCHPEPTAAVTLVMTALAVTTGNTLGGVVLVALAVLSGQLSIGWLNDLLDADRDIATGRTDKPLAAGEVGRRTVGVATGAAVAVCAVLSVWAAGPAGGLLHLVAVGAGLAYDVRLKSTPFSLLPYLVCFALLPVFVVAALPGSPLPPWWLPVAGGLLGGGAHFANVLPDLDDDAATGVRGLPHVLGARGSRVAAAVLLLGATLVIALAAPVPVWPAVSVPVLAAILLGAGFAMGRRRPGSRAPFRAVLLVAVLAVGLLLVAGPAVVA